MRMEGWECCYTFLKRKSKTREKKRLRYTYVCIFTHVLECTGLPDVCLCMLVNEEEMGAHISHRRGVEKVKERQGCRKERRKKKLVGMKKGKWSSRRNAFRRVTKQKTNQSQIFSFFSSRRLSYAPLPLDIRTLIFNPYTYPFPQSGACDSSIKKRSGKVQKTK